MGRMLEIATGLGWTGVHPTEDDIDAMMDATDEAEQWLNENIADEQHAFGWDDGEFFYRTRAEWEYES